MQWQKVRLALWLATVLAAATTCLPGCGSDVGDSSAAPPSGGDGSASDGTLGPEASEEAGNEDTSAPDSTGASTDDSSSEHQDATSAEDVGSTQEDTGSSQDAGALQEDTGSSGDTGTAQQDAGLEDAPGDSTVSDAQTADVVDAGGTADVVADVAAETGPHDAGPDGTTADAGGRDAAAEAGHDSGGGVLVPCETAGQANCVKCEGNETGAGANGGLCTPTEAIFVQKDIDAGIATAAGDDPASGCYTCLFNAGCIDDTAFGDTNHECGDTLAGGTAAECLVTESCFIGTTCAWGGSLASSAVDTCYCGTAPSSGSCNNSAPSGGANGACDTPIATGNGLAVNDGHNNLVNLTNPALASGKADQIFQCAISNSCDMCLH